MCGAGGHRPEVVAGHRLLHRQRTSLVPGGVHLHIAGGGHRKDVGLPHRQFRRQFPHRQGKGNVLFKAIYIGNWFTVQFGTEKARYIFDGEGTTLDDIYARGW